MEISNLGRTRIESNRTNELIRLFCIINNSRTMFPILEFIFALYRQLLSQCNAKIISKTGHILLELLIMQNKRISSLVRFGFDPNSKFPQYEGLR